MREEQFATRLERVGAMDFGRRRSAALPCLPLETGVYFISATLQTYLLYVSVCLAALQSRHICQRPRDALAKSTRVGRLAPETALATGHGPWNRPARKQAPLRSGPGVMETRPAKTA